ncbi:hypothetical protein FANTH_11977 [Fusarium anthophilum]|uniref:Uncharacterized protein n=1 Tax=Fusarium anthophilum TaxID=48485 RepID=A0A8H4YV53_9HYPO|nr:hypothetical protein FANTH_11977 [Fusarium anthophilum]
MEATNRFMIGVFGPTGAGKTKLGVSIAKSVHGQVISVDSLQCYSPGSIITAKPTPEETDGVDHHMIGYLEADEEPTNFVAEAIKRLEELYDQGVIPVVVGGSTSLTLPLLHDALNRGWRMAAITLLPHQSTYLSNIEYRLDEMVEAGLLEELSGLKLLEDKHLNGKPNFRKGVWKAIGYQELYPYLEARRSDSHFDQLLKTGLASMKENTFQYGIAQLEWIRQALSPFLHAQKIANMSLAVVDKASWISDVEKPAIRMASDFCHASTSISFHSINGSKPRVLCIFGGASSGNEPAHLEAAKSLGRVCHENGIKLVYGGGTTGVMGAIASTLVELSGPDAVHGVIPEALLKHEAKESGRHPKDPVYARYGKRTVVKDMHTRKRLMIQEVIDGGEGSGFVGLSGGYGTLEELFEVITWHQLGVLTHLFIFRRGEWNLYVFTILQAFAVLESILIYFVARAVEGEDSNIWKVTAISSCFTLSTLMGLSISMLIYRGWFHRLSRFPGPFWARLSNLYITFRAFEKLRLFEEVQQLHRKYGDLVRIGPSELSIIDPRALQALHSNSSPCTKGPWYSIEHPIKALQMTRDKEEHAYRRKAWDLAFSSKGQYSIDISFDVMGDLAFGRTFDMLKDGTAHPFMELVHSNMLMAGSLSHLTWMFPLLKRIPVLNQKNLEFQEWLKQQVDWRQKNKPDLPDVFSWILSDYNALNKPTAQDTINLRGDAQLIAVAGSDTTAASLTCLFFELAINPETCLNLQRELDQHYAEHDKPDHSSLSKLRYLQACINETMRLYPAIPSGLQRVTPPEGLDIGNTHLPGDTIVTIPTYTFNRGKGVRY